MEWVLYWVWSQWNSTGGSCRGSKYASQGNCLPAYVVLYGPWTGLTLLDLHIGESHKISMSLRSDVSKIEYPMSGKWCSSTIFQFTEGLGTSWIRTESNLVIYLSQATGATYRLPSTVTVYTRFCNQDGWHQEYTQRESVLHLMVLLPKPPKPPKLPKPIYIGVSHIPLGIAVLEAVNHSWFHVTPV